MEIFILISLGVVMVLLVGYVVRKLGGRPDDSLSDENRRKSFFNGFLFDEGRRKSLFDEDKKDIFEDNLDPHDPSSVAYRSHDD